MFLFVLGVQLTLGSLPPASGLLVPRVAGSAAAGTTIGRSPRVWRNGYQQNGLVPVEGGALTIDDAPQPDARPEVPPTPQEDAAPPPAADESTAGSVGGGPRVGAVRTSIAPTIDGRLDDAVWRTAARITDFVQQRPLDGAPATEETEVLIAYDSVNIYFGIYARYSDPSAIRANRVDRDRTNRDDTVAVYFDPFLDRQRAYVFSVNGYGVQADAVMDGRGFGGGPGGGGPGGGGPDGGGSPGMGIGGDTSWDALYVSAGQLVADGWTAEMAIPFKSLRYPAKRPGEPHRWGFQIQRDIESKNESVVWSPLSRDVMGFLRQMGYLEGIRDVSTSRNLEILPTFTGIKAGALDPSSGGFDDLGATPEAGLNVKYGITSNLTADFTLNPDFSQIESDQPQIAVNQRFPLFFPELRPFFLEGQEIFRVPGPVTFIHTRTVVDPRFGAKLTGKMGRTSLGLLFATDEGPGNTDDPTDPAAGLAAYFFMGRLRYDILSESHIGIIATDREFMDTYSRLGGVDGEFRIGRNQRFTFKAMSTERRTADGAILSGPLLDVSYRKEARHLSYGVSHFQIDPGFGTDAGFVRRVDMRQTNVNAGYRWWPEGWIVNWGPRGNYSRNYDFAGVLQDEDINANVNFQFARNINLFGGVNTGMERYGGVDFEATRLSMGGNVNSSRRISFGAFLGTGDQIRFVTDPYLGRSVNFSANMTLRPFSRLQSQVNLTSTRYMDPRTDTEVFNVKIFRGLTTYQFTDRLLARNITEFNTLDKTLGVNLLATYRLNAGTVFYIGYDDRYRDRTQIDDFVFPVGGYERTNRAFFTKLQYLFRY